MLQISIPKNKDAMQRLRINQCIEGDLQEINMERRDYNTFLYMGLIDKINSSLGVIIDIYESEKIIGKDKVIKLKEIIKKYSLNHPNNKELKLLLEYIDIAIENDTGVFFFF